MVHKVCITTVPIGDLHPHFASNSRLALYLYCPQMSEASPLVSIKQALQQIKVCMLHAIPADDVSCSNNWNDCESMKASRLQGIYQVL